MKDLTINNLQVTINTCRSIVKGQLSKVPLKGFTLIELLTVVGIFAVIGTLSVSIISLTLRGAKKSELLGKVRLSGNLALSQVTRSIRYAKGLDTPSVCSPSVTTDTLVSISLNDDERVTYACLDGGISINSIQLIDTNTVETTACSFTCSQRTINDPPTILLQFSLRPKNASLFAENYAPISFQTSVTMRNYNNK